MKISVFSLIIAVIGLLIAVISFVIGIKKKQDILKILAGAAALITTLSFVITNIRNLSIDISPDISSISVNTMISFTPEVPFCTIYYTFDGSSPKKEGIKYEKAFMVDEENILVDKITIRYTAKIGPFWLNNEKKEYTVILDSSTKNQESNNEYDNMDRTNDNNDIGDVNFNTDRTDEIIVDNDKKVLIPDNAEIVLRTASGYYLSRNDDGNYYANKSEIDNTCIIKIVITDDGYTGFYNVNSETYATAAIDKDPVVLCSVNTYMKSWECFTLYQDNDFIIISSQGKERNNDEYKYITSDEDDTNRAIYVRAKDAKAWEDFSILIYSPDDEIWKNPFTSETILDNGCH